MYNLPFAQIPEWVFKSDIPAGAIKCYLYLDAFMDRNLNFCYVSLGRLADEMKVSKRMVTTYLKSLKDSGAIVVIPRYKPDSPKEQMTSIYIKMSTPPDYSASESLGSLISAIKSANPDWNLGTPEGRVDVAKVPYPQEAQVPDPQEPELPYPQEAQVPGKQEPINNNQLTITSANASARDSKNSLEEEFEQWWKYVPRKEAKRDAFKAFKAIRKEASLEDLIRSIKRYSASVRDREKRYIKQPAGWLRSGMWEDTLGESEFSSIQKLHEELLREETRSTHSVPSLYSELEEIEGGTL